MSVSGFGTLVIGLDLYLAYLGPGSTGRLLGCKELNFPRLRDALGASLNQMTIRICKLQHGYPADSMAKEDDLMMQD